MPDIDVVDSTWICARPAVVAAMVADPVNWRRWWPELDLLPDEWRGDRGMRWTVRADSSGNSGSMEVWLEPALDGVVLHYFLRLDAAGGRPMTRRRRVRLSDVHRRRAKRSFWALADQLDPGRWTRVGAPRG
ncbi:MAG: polyketide cyclase / dehydrase and lipid transport [Pseudonocardiales bacterium]|nr:MAG: polyketide cyclase / dehydrase and lipid transport [Pseudonocardiales bacterium]